MSVSRREFLGYTAAAAAPESFQLQEATLDRLQQRMTKGLLTARGLTAMYLDRIQRLDKAGPRLNSVIEINPDALAIARELDRERKAGKFRGPLHGIPILIKDNIDTADKMKTTAGSLALLNARPLKDSFVVERLRASGAVILGKTNLSEWANIRSSHSSSGWSARGGQTRNPYVLDRNPCGSSSGSGVAVAASLCAAAVGTETDGSIVCPASLNGIVGLKPTVGLVSRSGIIPISVTQDTAGPMTRTVQDAAILLSGLIGVDPEDPATARGAGQQHADYTRFLDASALRGARLGVARNYFGFNDHVDAMMEATLAKLRSLGAEIIDPVGTKDSFRSGGAEFDVLLYELKDGLAKYFARLGPNAPVKCLKDVIEFNEKNKGQELLHFGQDTLIKAEAKGGLDSPEYLEALAKCRRASRDEGIDALMAEHRLNAIIAPTAGGAWPTDLVNGDGAGGGSSSAAAMAGYPSITVPMGFVRELPLGLSFFAGAWSEPALLRLAYSFEQATKARKPPRYLRTLS